MFQSLEISDLWSVCNMLPDNHDGVYIWWKCEHDSVFRFSILKWLGDIGHIWPRYCGFTSLCSVWHSSSLDFYYVAAHWDNKFVTTKNQYSLETIATQTRPRFIGRYPRIVMSNRNPLFTFTRSCRRTTLLLCYTQSRKNTYSVLLELHMLSRMTSRAWFIEKKGKEEFW